MPLTLDRETVKILLMEAFIGLAGEKTAIGDAITLAVKRIHDQEEDAGEQVLVLLTDKPGLALRVKDTEDTEAIAGKVEKSFNGLMGDLTADRLFMSQEVGDRTIITAIAIERASGTTA